MRFAGAASASYICLAMAIDAEGYGGMEGSPPEDSGDLSDEELARERTRTRINALVLILVLVWTTVAPYPWSLFAPLLFVLPLIYSIRRRLHGRAAVPAGEPYSCAPKDPMDPRRYKPIG
jgi:hypothetical protein